MSQEQTMQVLATLGTSLALVIGAAWWVLR
jgi:hypothetical protein